MRSLPSPLLPITRGHVALQGPLSLEGPSRSHPTRTHCGPRSHRPPRPSRPMATTRTTDHVCQRRPHAGCISRLLQPPREAGVYDFHTRMGGDFQGWERGPQDHALTVGRPLTSPGSGTGHRGSTPHGPQAKSATRFCKSGVTGTQPRPLPAQGPCGTAEHL